MNDPPSPLQNAPPAAPEPAEHRRRPPKERHSFAARLFGYDLFISFALGHLPRGTQSYASDLARQLRERDFAVFYSEDEAAPGDELNETLKRALARARILVVIANKGMLQRPGWVKTEVETFRALHPDRPIIPISIDGALTDPEIVPTISSWLPVGDTIWLDEPLDAVAHGIASRDVVTRLCLAPTHMRASQWWRATVTGVGLALVALTASSIWSEHRAREHANEALAEAQRAQRAEARAVAELRNSTGLRLRAESSAMLAGLRPDPDERALLQLLAALRLGGAERPPDAEAEGELLASLRHERFLVRLVGTADEFIAMAVSPGGERLVTVADDHTLQLWNARTATPLGAPIEADANTTRAIAFSPDGRSLITGSNDTTLRLWDVGDTTLEPALAFPFTGHMDAVRSAIYSPDGSLVASGSDDRTAMLWDVRTSKPTVPPLTGHRDAVTAVAFSPDGKRLVTGSNDNTLRLWDVATGRPIGKPFTGHTDSVRCVAFSPDGKRLVSGGWDDTLIIWDVARGRPAAPPLVGHDGLVRSVAFSRDGREILSAGEDGTLRLWDAATGAPLGEPLAGHGDAVTSARFTQAGGDRIVSISLDRSLRLWNPRTTSPVGAPLASGSRQLVSLAVSADGKRIAGAGEDLRLHLWRVSANRASEQDDKNGNAADHRDEVPSGEIALPPWPSPTLALRFSPDGARLAAGGYDGSLRLADGRTGEAIGEPVAAHPGPVSAVAWSPDSKFVATGGWDATVRVWHADGRPAGPPLIAHDHWIAALAWRPDGRGLVSASADRSLRHWNVTPGPQFGQLIGHPMTGHDNWVLAAAFSPDGKRIYSGSADESLRIWDADTGEPVGEPLEGHRRWVTSVDVSPDGRHLVSGSWDRTLRLWHAETGVPVGRPLEGHTDAVQWVAFRNKGQLIHSASRNGALHLWAGPARWPGMLCGKLTRNMSREQWTRWVSKDIDYLPQCPDLPAPTK